MVLDFTKWGLRFGPKASARVPLATDGIPIGTTPEGDDVVWPAPSRDRASHLCLLAASGAGKTVMAANAIIRECTAPVADAACIVVDAKGDLVDLVLTGLAALSPASLARVHYLDPFGPGFPFSLNKLALGATPLDLRATQLAGLVSEVSTATGSQRHLGVGARQIDVLVHVLLGALDTDHPGASVLWALDALTLPDGMARLAAVTRSPRARAFLASARLGDELRASCSSRIRTAFAASSQLERLVSASTAVAWNDLLAPGAITLVHLGTPPAGLTALQASWANLVVRLAIEHLMERPSPFPGHHCRVVVDEAQVVASVLADVAERLLTTGRSRGVSLVTLSQGTTLLQAASPTLLRVLLTNTPIKVIGRLALADADLLAREQAPRPGVEESISVLRGRLTARICNLADREFLVLTPGDRRRFVSAPVDLAAWQTGASAEEVERVKNRHALPPSTTPRAELPPLDQPRRGGRRRPPPSGPELPLSPEPSVPRPPPRGRWG